jgi:hypothetical protein
MYISYSINKSHYIKVALRWEIVRINLSTDNCEQILDSKYRDPSYT